MWKGNVEQIEHDAVRETDTGDLVDSLRVSFFLHIYHENQTAGGIKSLLYLREAITKAQLLRVDREATYSSLDGSDQQLLRRLIWLLFVTERGVAMLHKLPVVLRPNTLFPWATDHSRDEVLPAFLKLVHLFYVFDQSGIFELLRNSDTDVSNMEALARGCLELLQRKLVDSDRSGDGDGGSNDVQKADIFVTRQWMRAVLWRAAKRFGVVVDGIDPVGVAGEFLALVSRLPTTALESQGPTLEFKTYEIATAVVDAVMDRRSILSSSRGGNKTLLALLNSKLAMASPDLRLLLRPSPAALSVPFLPQQVQWDTSISTSFLDMIGQEEVDHLADLSWPPLDLGNLLRSPSPMTQMLLEPHQQDQYHHQHQQSSIPGMAWAEPRNTGMVYRRLGRSGLHVSAISLGSWLTYGGYADEEKTLACVKKAYDLGINFFDTAENYTAGKAEIALGNAIKKFGWKRSDLVISTKINWGAQNGEILVNNHGLSRKHIIEGLEASLERLGLKYVDIVYAHRPDRLTPIEETVRAFNYVIDKGMALYWGTSEWSAEEIAEAVGVARDLRMIPPIVEQPFYNMLVRNKVEGEFQRLYARHGLGLTTFSPIKMGILSGKYNDAVDGKLPPDSRFGSSQDKFAKFMREKIGSSGDEEWKKEIETVRRLKPVADKLGISQSQLAVAWCLKNENVSSVITGASKPEQIEETVGALKILDKLTPEVMAEIDEITGAKVTLDPARQD
ncbi:unnamed protein product [Clonostachys chloroleuca]|uniref:NADP-dependent oxidoreductase domain-containing protein n=1 Tax=Clonostachys chloroleuca TaxID=1926264 RepID=A0AA35LP23_9HYPO|nr:unnamed protein product [Clonostachys chloroleuca]